jgi:hypothetical protein
MLSEIHQSFRVLAKRPEAAVGEITAIIERFPRIPSDYLRLIASVTELELEHECGQYLRIWSPAGCFDQDDGYDISKRIPGAIPIGDDGGGHVIMYMEGCNGFGLYHVGYGNLDAEAAVWIAPTLTEFLTSAAGLDSF